MAFLDGLLVVHLLLNFLILGTSRIRAVVQAVALQGVILGLLPLLVHRPAHTQAVLVCLVTALLKGAIIPGMLFRAMRQLPIRREVEPLVGLITSMVLGAVGTALAIAFSRQLPLVEGAASGLLVPAALSSVFAGFLILTTRVKAITQATGYLMLENGIFIFGMQLLEAMPLMVEMGALLDLVVGIFVMGIIISHINREFASVNTERLAALKE